MALPQRLQLDADSADTASPVTELGVPQVDRQLAELAALVGDLRAGVGTAIEQSAPERAIEDRLVLSRLGVAAGLFSALRCKYAPTAAHSLRVALGCSAWSLAAKVPHEVRDQLEIAALLHDVGKIGVPDAVLLKPSSLSADEAMLMERHRAAGLEILRAFCGDGPILETVRYAPAWYDGSRDPQGLRGENLPLGARMLAIVDAFDSMTTDHVYRRAMSRERALGELFQWAGTQFDPNLVREYAEVVANERFHDQTTQHWLHSLDASKANAQWLFCPNGTTASKNSDEQLFEKKLLDNMQDGVLFVDANRRIIAWNHGAERMTGIAADSVIERQWLPELVGMRDQRQREVLEFDDPVALTVKHGEQEIQRVGIMGRNGRTTMVDIHAMPVTAPDGTLRGAAVMLRDASSQVSLEKLCHSLHEKATKDNLTQVANRAEFDRTHAMFVAAHLERRLPCSLIVCDIDHFKAVNDTFGHQAGDEALKVFAQLLKTFCRPGDLVARYGGEEFVILCADCTNSTATQKADQARKALSELPIAALGGKPLTASFGVTEVQAGDTPETMLRRADRALYEAKERGRNTVVQLGCGIHGEEEDKSKVGRGWWSRWFGGAATGESNLMLEKWLVTAVPMKVTIEKLRGFVADHHAEIDSIDENLVKLKIDSQRLGAYRRANDRPISFQVELRFDEENAKVADGQSTCQRTRIYVAIRPRRSRDRRQADAVESARQVMSSIKSYLVATETTSPAESASTADADHSHCE
jgi:diguanylate cyclase (GGDEF)-like protein/PAS domain S-box-containing protein